MSPPIWQGGGAGAGPTSESLQDIGLPILFIYDSPGKEPRAGRGGGFLNVNIVETWSKFYVEREVD